MADLSFSRTSISQIYCLICTDFVLFLSFVFSHPLYLLYFIFFSPYLLKLLSFLSPLCITLSILLLALVFDNFPRKFSETGSSFLLSTSYAVLDILSPEVTNEFDDFEEFELYKNVFLLDGTSSFGAVESSDADADADADASLSEPECEEKYCLGDVDEVLVRSFGPEQTSNLHEVAETTKSCLFEENKEMLHCKMETQGDYSDKNFDKVVIKEIEMSTIGSEAVDINIDHCDTGKEYTKIIALSVESQDKIVRGNVLNEVNVTNFDSVSSNLGSYGSMRKEKEWKRTLACKLFEERYKVAEGDEGMDSLWETYESDSMTKSSRKDDVKKKDTKKKMIIENLYDEDEDGDDVEMSNGKLCCLQAFKISAGKVNLGVGRTNIVRITKALKGIGWLHHVKSQRHVKKERC